MQRLIFGLGFFFLLNQGFSQNKEMKFIDGDIMYGYNELSFRKAAKLAEAEGCLDAIPFFRKAAKKESAMWFWGTVAVLEAGVGGAMVGIGEPAGIAPIAASVTTLVVVISIEKKQKYLALEGIDIFNNCIVEQSVSE